MESLLRLHGHKHRLHPSRLLLVSKLPFIPPVVANPSLALPSSNPFFSHSYPETKNLSLEEIDYLFTKDGNTGLKKFGQRSQPVQESLKPIGEIEKDVERQNSAAGIGEAQYIEGKEGKDEKSSEEELKM